MPKDDFWDELGKFYDPFGINDFNNDGIHNMDEALESEYDFWDENDSDCRQKIDLYDDEDSENDFIVGKFVTDLSQPQLAQSNIQSDLPENKTEVEQIIAVISSERKAVLVARYRKNLIIEVISGIVGTIFGSLMIHFSIGNDVNIVYNWLSVLIIGLILTIAGGVLFLATGLLYLYLTQEEIIKLKIKHMKRIYEFEFRKQAIKSKSAKEYAGYLDIVKKDKGLEKSL